MLRQCEEPILDTPGENGKRLFKAITSSAKESGDKIIFRPAFDFIRCSGLNDFTMVHNAQAVSQIGSLFHIVGNKNNGQPQFVVECFYKILQLPAGNGV